MRKFKLIKWYPSLHNIYHDRNDFYVEQKKENGDYYPNKKCCYSFFKACEIENNSEFWEEVVDKDYEVLSVYSPSTGFGVTMKDGKPTTDYHTVQKFEIHKVIDWEIESIKRLSDGETFSVGDLIYNSSYYSEKISPWVLYRIDINHNNNLRFIKKPSIKFPNNIDGYTLSNQLKKL